MEANWETNPLHYKAYRNVVIHETADPEVIVVEQDITGTAATTGRDFTLPNIVVLRVRDGQIVHFRDYGTLWPWLKPPGVNYRHSFLPNRKA